MFDHIRAIKAALTADKLKEVDKLVNKTKQELNAWVEAQTLEVLVKFQKFQKLEEVSDKLCKELNGVHRDLFKHKMHYVLNGIDKLVDQRKHHLRSQPAAVPNSAAADEDSEEDEDRDGDDEEEERNEEDRDDVNKTIIEKTVVETYTGTPNPSMTVTKKPCFLDACTQMSPCKDNMYCVPLCAFEGKQGNQSMTRCTICMRWHHLTCTGDDEEDYAEAAWTCPACRKMPATIYQLQTDLAKVMKMLQQLTDENTNIREIREVLEEEEEESEEDGADIVEGSQSSDDSENSDSSHVSEESSDDDQNESTPPPNQEAWAKQRRQKRREKRKKNRQAAENVSVAHTVTIIGDSMPKHIDCDYIRRKSAANVCYKQEGGDIGKTIDFIQNNADSLRTQPIIILTGTNDVVREGSQTTERRFQRLEANLLHYKYEHVAISSIIYRSSTPRVQESIKRQNTFLQMVCLRNKWTFIDNDFIDRSCLGGDGLHLNGFGSEKLSTIIAKGVNEMVCDINH